MNNKKTNIGIITLYYRNYNYGGLLQAYALTTFLNHNMNVNAEQISFIPKKTQKNFIEIWYLIKGFSISSLLDKLFIKLEILFNIITKPDISNKFIERKNRCDKFRSKIPHSSEVSEDDLIKLNECYDIFITGSDQVWNPNMFQSAYFLSFVSDEKTKISYAASLAVNKLSMYQKHKLIPLMKRINHISVREKKAMQILSKCMPEKEIKMVLDPVFLLNKNDWDKITKPLSKKGSYIYAYFLGERKCNINLAKKISQKLQMPIVTIPYLYRRYNNFDHDFANVKVYDAGPDEFISLIKNAELILTDSFHATVFSIIYHKNFWVFDRDKEQDINSMNSRLTFLLDELQLADRRITHKKEINLKTLNKPIDYQKADYYLKIKRKNSIRYLYKTINAERNQV